MKLIDLVSPGEFVGLLDSAASDNSSEARALAIQETMPYFNALVGAGYLQGFEAVEKVATLMSALSIIQECLNRQKVAA